MRKMGGGGQIKSPGKERVGVEFPDFTGRTYSTHQNPLIKQAKEEAILNNVIEQDCLTPSDMFFFNVLSLLLFYFSYSFVKA